jgi:hypothetical protein
LGKLDGAQTLIAGVASTSGLLKHFAETKTLITRYLP